MNEKNKTIWKYPLHPTDIQSISMPKGAVILSCQIQYTGMCIWAIVDPSQEKEERCIEIIGTGNPAPDTFNVERVFIDTVQMHAGDLVWHVFERILKDV